jgi:transcriptional regulator with XRE-family HTH domain
MNGLADAPLDADLLARALRHVGASVRDLREAHGLNQRDAARRAGLNQTRWHRVESGNSPRLADLLAIQHFFGVESLETFFGTYPSRRVLQRDTADGEPSRHGAAAIADEARRAAVS